MGFTNQNTSNTSKLYLKIMGFLAFGFLKTSKIPNGSRSVLNRNSMISISNHGLVDSASSGTNYRILKESFEMSKYIKILPNYFTKILLNFKTSNHKLPNEIGRWKSIPHSERKCSLCSNDVGDEYHYIMSCVYFREQRQKFIKKCYIKYPNTLKFKQLFCESSKRQLINLCQFINIINKECPIIY